MCGSARRHGDGRGGGEGYVPVAHAVGAVWVPVEGGVAIACGAFHGVPGHPAIGLAVDDNGAGFIAVGEGCEV